jgi:hypothetical protein
MDKFSDIPLSTIRTYDEPIKITIWQWVVWAMIVCVVLLLFLMIIPVDYKENFRALHITADVNME